MAGPPGGRGRLEALAETASSSADESVDIINPTEVLLGDGIDPETVTPTSLEECWNEPGPNANHQ